jgi:hypothetical protein
VALRERGYANLCKQNAFKHQLSAPYDSLALLCRYLRRNPKSNQSDGIETMHCIAIRLPDVGVEGTYRGVR